jgi:hypothetical protein
MNPPAMRIAVICFASAMILFNKPLGRMTVAWQRMTRLGTAANETFNRITYVIGGVIFLILAIWAT